MKLSKKKLTKTVVTTSVCFTALLSAFSASADSIVTYSAYECLGGTIINGHGAADEGLSFSNTSTRCPLDRINSDNTANISNIIVRLYDASNTGSISCTAFSCNGQGDTCSQSSTGSTGTAFTGATFVNLGSVVAYSTGYAYVDCTFPTGQNYIISYRATD